MNLNQIPHEEKRIVHNQEKSKNFSQRSKIFMKMRGRPVLTASLLQQNTRNEPGMYPVFSDQTAPNTVSAGITNQNQETAYRNHHINNVITPS